MNLLNIEQTKDFLLKCISSCDTHEQLNLCREMVDQFIIKRFKHYTTFEVFMNIKAQLDECIYDQMKMIVEKKYENVLTVTA
jgi:hypothetical protein